MGHNYFYIELLRVVSFPPVEPLEVYKTPIGYTLLSDLGTGGFKLRSTYVDFHTDRSTK